MKHMCKRISAFFLALSLALGLCGCSAALGDRLLEQQAIALVQGNVDELYLGKFSEEYMESVGSTEEECLANYKDGLAIEAEYFAGYFGIEYLTDEIEKAIISLYHDIYSHSSYTVGSASKLDDNTVVVKMEVQPIDLFVQVLETFQEDMADFYAQYPSEMVDAMDEAAYQAYDAHWAQEVIALCRKALPNLGHEQTVTLTVQVVLTDDYWQISDASMADINEAIITYP
ncbi:MAG: hypothetical protein E7457_05695 [Ruminococcaceae bacterium]|nr:hypothetical protein [Oscillospiraceae bacterium]